MEDKFKHIFSSLEDEDEDIEELIQRYPVAFEDTSKNESEIRRIHSITEKMAKRPTGFLKPASAITTAYILSRIKGIFTADQYTFALPLTIAALFRIRCGEKFDEGQSRPWQELKDLNLFLFTEYGFNSKGVEGTIEILDEYNLIEIDRDYSEDKENPRIKYRANDELYNMLLSDEILF